MNEPGEKETVARISIIVPVYNVEAYLRKCVDSILCQTLGDIEILLIDDGSTDSCGGICDEYANQDDRIHVIHKANGGLSDARNAGIDVARGKFIGFVDGDDYVEPEMFESLYRACIEDGTRIAACDYLSELTGSGKAISHSTGQHQIMTSEDFFKEVLQYGSAVGMGVWDKLFEKSLFEQTRFQVGKLHEDTDILYRLAFQVNEISYLSIPYYIHCLRTGSITDRCYGTRDCDRYAANYGMFQYISTNHPGLIDVASENRCLSNLSIVRNMVRSEIYDKQMYQKIKTENRKLLSAVLKRNCLTFRMKSELRLSCVGYHSYTLFYRLYKLLKPKSNREDA